MSVLNEVWFGAVEGETRERWLAQGEALFRQGDKVHAIFALVEGRIRLVRHAREGAACVLHVIDAGDTFAEAALFSEVYHCDAVADLPSRVTAIPKPAMLAAFAANPEIASAFTARLAHHVQDLRSRLEIRNIRSAAERTHQYLLLQAFPERRSVVFVRPLKDVAAEIGLTHEAFYRALSTLEKRRAIRRNGREIILEPSD
jgi:CRP-like cAMP-binding protein